MNGRIVRIVEVDRFVRDEGTVIVAEGTDTATGERVTFACDARPMGALFQAYEQGLGPYEAHLESWQVLMVESAQAGEGGS